MVPEHELTVGIMEIIAADLLSGDPGGWRPGKALHTSPGLALIPRVSGWRGGSGGLWRWVFWI